MNKTEFKEAVIVFESNELDRVITGSFLDELLILRLLDAELTTILNERAGRFNNETRYLINEIKLTFPSLFPKQVIAWEPIEEELLRVLNELDSASITRQFATIFITTVTKLQKQLPRSSTFTSRTIKRVSKTSFVVEGVFILT